MAAVGQTKLDAVSASFTAIFHRALDEVQIPVILEDLAFEVQSDGKSEDYGDMDMFATMREWIGQRQFADLEAKTINVPNRDWEASLSVARNDIDDDRLGIYEPTIADLPDAYFRKRRFEMKDLLVNGNAVNANAPIFDGLAFFSNVHTITNQATQSNLSTTSDLTAANFDAAVLVMRKLLNHLGEPILVEPDLLVVGPDKANAARDLFNKRTLASGETNVHDGAIRIHVDKALLSHTSWYLFDTTRTIKPFIFQNRRSLAFAEFSTGSEVSFRENRYEFGIDARFAYAYYAWQLAHRNDV